MGALMLGIIGRFACPATLYFPPLFVMVSSPNLHTIHTFRSR
jgi:hypothetical protein